MPSITNVLQLLKLAQARHFTLATSVPHSRLAKLATVLSATTTLPNSRTAGCRKQLTILRALWRVWTGAMKLTSCLMKLAASFGGVCHAPLPQIGQGLLLTCQPVWILKQRKKRGRTTSQRNAITHANSHGGNDQQQSDVPICVRP